MRSPSRSEAGYNLVMLMVLLTILSIVLAASLPAWSNVIRRDKEEELIFRGLQYAEAIRVFQNRFQRPPIRLEELVEVEPRSIRRLWKDPMTESGKWALIPLQGPTAPLQPQVPADEDEQGRRDEDGDGEPDGQDGEDSEDGFGLPKKEDIQVGPFKGVHSRSGKTSIMVFNGKDRYDEWHFTIDLFLAAATGPGGNPEQQRLPMNMSARWIGRPLPEFLQPRQGNGLPGDDNSGLDSDGRGGRKGGDPGRGTGKP
jgi:type II secretory pathway pseudopilin PulG